MSRSRVAASLLALAACNGALGLDQTVRDRDGDGIPDDIDNCPSTFNPDQINSDGQGAGDACTVCPTPLHVDLDGDGFDDGCDLCLGPGPIGVDTDGDGIDDGCDPCIGGVSSFHVDANHDGVEDGCEWCMGGGVGIDIDHDGLDDACDQCLNGPPHDEDGDGVEDGCDNCPALANKDQHVAVPGDLRGSACTVSYAPYLAIFDPFLVDRSRLYTGALPPGWTIEHDQIVIASPDAAGDRTTILIDPSPFIATLRARFGVTSPMSTIGLFAVTGGSQSMRCTLGADGLLTLTTLDVQPQTAKVAGVDISGAVTIVLSAQPSAIAGSSQAICSATGQDAIAHVTAAIPITDPLDGWHPGMTAGYTTATFDFLEITAGVALGML